MTAQERWAHAAAAYSLLYRALEVNGTQGGHLCERAAVRLRQAEALGLAETVEGWAEEWYPADSEIRLMLDRVAEEAGRLERETLR